MDDPTFDTARFLEEDAVTAARRLLGCELVRNMEGIRLVGRIVETEAYHQTDAASHSYKGKTPRTAVLFGPPAHLYVYFTYGMHYCMNIVTGPEGEGSAVLIRAIEPLAGADIMRQNRDNVLGVAVTNGPAKTCQALAVDQRLNGHGLQEVPLRLRVRPPVDPKNIVQTTRVGISQSKDLPWRFYIAGNPYVSKA